jgi:hypothetical protein
MEKKSVVTQLWYQNTHAGTASDHHALYCRTGAFVLLYCHLSICRPIEIMYQNVNFFSDLQEICVLVYCNIIALEEE